MRIEVLGPIRLSTDGVEDVWRRVPVEVPERHLRTLLASVIDAGGEPVSADVMIDRLWGDDLPADPKKVLQAKLSRLRTIMDRARPGARELLTHTPTGYRLAVETEAVDAGLFRSKVAQARRMSSSSQKAALLREALTLWRGEPYGDVSGEIWLAPAVAELHDIRGDALEALVETWLELGDPHQALSQVNGAIDHFTTREGLVSSVMIALYQIGRQHEALEMFETLRRRLSEELGVDPTPRIRELHAQMLRHDPALGAKPAPDSAATSGIGHSNVPAETHPMIGRREESMQIEALLTESRLVTLTGVGGVGKTRLALHVAREQASEFERGVWVLDLTELTTTPKDLPAPGERIASLMTVALGLPEQDATTNSVDQLSAALRERSALLVLDNCEHVVAEAARFTIGLLRRAPRLRVLATSRESLGLPEEQRYEVNTLSTAVAEDDGPSEAASFFVTRARSSDHHFRRDADNAEAIEQLCRRLDGLPLALELAAARIRGLSVTDLLARLSDRLTILRRTGDAVPRRQQTLRGMIDWSWALLGETERAVLRRLAVHPGSVDLQTVEATCSDETVDRADVMDVLTGLVDRSLVTTTSSQGGVRYGLLESIASYASEKLDSSAERAATSRRHLLYYREFALAADEGLRTREQRRWLSRFAAERAQIRYAFEEAVRTGDGRSATSLTLTTFWYQVCVPGFSIGLWTNCYSSRLGQDLRQIIELPDVPADDLAAVTVLAACMQGNPADGAQNIRQALDDFSDDTVTKARVEGFAGATLLSAGLREPGERHVDHALSIMSSHREDWDLAMTACRRDWLLVTLWREAPRGLPDGRDLDGVIRDVDDGYGRMYALAVEHRFAELVGDHRRSATAVAAALKLSRELDVESEVSLWLIGTAIAAIREGRPEEALTHLAEARAISADIGFTIGASYADFAESMIARQRHDTDRARTLLDRWRAFTKAATAELLTESEHGFLAVQEGDLVEAAATLGALVSSSGEATRATARMLELAAALLLDVAPRSAAELLGTAEAERGRTNAEPSVNELWDIRLVRDRLAESLPNRELSEALAQGRQRNPQEELRTAANRLIPTPHDDHDLAAGGSAAAQQQPSQR